MLKKVGVIILQGLGEPKGDNKKENHLIKSLKKRLGESYFSRIEFETINYHKDMQSNEHDLWKRMKNEKLSNSKTRQWVVNNISDVLNITNYRGENIGDSITSTIRESINNLASKLDENSDIIAITQSLGNQVLSNYIWDACNNNGIFSKKPASDTEKLKNLRSWNSTGNNIALFVAGLKEADIKTIEKPNGKFEWFNYYDNNDLLGWPMRPICSGYREILNVCDIPINTGGLFLSHCMYWRKRSFIKPLSETIKSIIDE